MIYTRGGTALTLETAQFAGGVIRLSGTSQEINYLLTDHLGSVRAVVTPTGAVRERNDYYAFGARHVRSDHPQNANRLKFNGKEDQTTGNLKYLDYGARMYNPRLGRWSSIDPLAEKYYALSPYDYVGGNPISRIDPNGMDWFYNNHSGNVYYNSSYGFGDAGFGAMTGDGWNWMGQNGMFDYIQVGESLHSPDWVPSALDRDLSVLLDAGIFFDKYKWLDGEDRISAMIEGSMAKDFMKSKGYNWMPTEYDYYETTHEVWLPEGMNQITLTDNSKSIGRVYAYSYVHESWKLYHRQEEVLLDDTWRRWWSPQTIHRFESYRIDAYNAFGRGPKVKIDGNIIDNIARFISSLIEIKYGGK